MPTGQDRRRARRKDEGGRRKEKKELTLSLFAFFHPSSFILHPCFSAATQNTLHRISLLRLRRAFYDLPSPCCHSCVDSGHLSLAHVAAGEHKSAGPDAAL